MVSTELSGSRSRPEGGESYMSAGQVASGILDALEYDKYEVALGRAKNLHLKRDELFGAIND